MRFSNQAPVTEEREDYVSALAALRRAARAGDAQALAFLPGWAAATAPIEEPPLDAIPDDWQREAIERANAPRACEGR